MKSTKRVLAWHFIRNDCTLRDGQKLRVGKVYRLPLGKQLEMCRSGFHASAKALDALNYAPGAIVCRVELRGEIMTDTDQMVATERKALWAADATRTLRLFAISETRRALMAERKAGREPDARSWEALRVTLRWLDGKASDQERVAAEAAAWAAWRATQAAEETAWAAAEAAAAKMGPMRRAAWRATQAAEEAQNERLTKALMALHSERGETR